MSYQFDTLDDLTNLTLPEDMYHDGWNGAAGAEISDEPYAPYPHLWDRGLVFCQTLFALHTRTYEGMFDRPIDKLPAWVFRRALPYLPKRMDV